VIDYRNFREPESLKNKFLNNHPFPWIVIDGFLQDGYCEQLADGFAAAMKGCRLSRTSRSTVQRKAWTSHPMSPLHQEFFKEINSGGFSAILKSITGIDRLYTDPNLTGGGLHECHDGGFLMIHTDFNQLRSTKHHRALNLMLYLNPVWEEGWGGCLELWPKSLAEKAHTILPLMNRMILFRTSENSYHGHPIPLTMPKGTTRKSLAVYYYEDWPEGLKARPNTHYVQTPK